MRELRSVASLIDQFLFLLPLTAPMPQSQASAGTRLIKFSGTVKDAPGNPLSRAMGITSGLSRGSIGAATRRAASDERTPIKAMVQGLAHNSPKVALGAGLRVTRYMFSYMLLKAING